jgi:hypothetical protein
MLHNPNRIIHSMTQIMYNLIRIINHLGQIMYNPLNFWIISYL